MSDFDLPITAMGPNATARASSQLVNEERVAAGRRPLKYAPLAARVRAQAWAMICTRTRAPRSRQLPQRVLRFPFILAGMPRSRRVGENLAWATGGFSTPREIVKDWMSSPGHRANILRKEWHLRRRVVLARLARARPPGRRRHRRAPLRRQALSATAG